MSIYCQRAPRPPFGPPAPRVWLPGKLENLLFTLIRQSWPKSRRKSGRGLLKFVKGDFDAFLESGILAHGFLRLRRTECAHETLVAFFLSRPTPARFVLPPRSWKLTRPCRPRSAPAFRSRPATTPPTPRAPRTSPLYATPPL